MRRPTLLFLHGTGDGDPTDAWHEVLDAALTRVGYPDLSEIEVLAPKYATDLRGVDDDVSLPKVTVRALRGDAGRLRIGHIHDEDAHMIVPSPKGAAWLIEEYLATNGGLTGVRIQRDGASEQ